MRRIGFCVSAALMVSFAACKAEQSANEAEGPTNQAQQPAKKGQPAAKAAAPKCPDFSTQLPIDATPATRRVYACVERNALLYAKGPDSPEALSKAVMAKCKDAIVRYVDQEAKKAGVKPPYKEAFESWQAHTLPIIAEARARRCFG
ncbi:MAG TPA: hypothetical protein VL336_07665 [Sphingomicrobium sp.]|nr:hypothetical protein [Sphingomicrobium sp.]